MDIAKRNENEKKFSNWEDFSDQTRKYWFEIPGHAGWKARYVKIVDKAEVTLYFAQEIYNENGVLVEIHEKYPIDKGHRKIE